MRRPRHGYRIDYRIVDSATSSKLSSDLRTSNVGSKYVRVYMSRIKQLCGGTNGFSKSSQIASRIIHTYKSTTLAREGLLLYA